MKDVSSLKKKLAGYSAMAGAMIAVNPGDTDAQIVYHDIDPDTVLSYYSPTYDLDLNNDGTVDFGLSWSTDLGTFDLYGIMYVSTWVNELLHKNYGFNILEALSSCQNISAIPPGDAHWDDAGSAFMLHGNNASPWINNGADRYAGLKLHLPDGNHYGWIRMTCVPGPGNGFYGYMTLKDYAYQTMPDSAITTPCYQQVKEVVPPDLFNALVEDHQLILHFHQSLPSFRMIFFNKIGVKLSEQVITQRKLVMDVSRLAMGIYFVVVDDGEKRQVKKVVIE